jgi:hypothetical protein
VAWEYLSLAQREGAAVVAVLRISIKHCSDTSFLDAFRSDLAESSEQVTIFSPFLSPNRAIHYYPAFQALAARHVVIDVYARPKMEQPSTLRDSFDTVERGLMRAGVKFHTRPTMHEKVGVIDRAILWHGSLNILSHNDTRESMLRIESPDVVREVMEGLGIQASSVNQPAPGAQPEESVPEAVAVECPACPDCGLPMIRYDRSGMWICSRSPHCAGTLPLTAAVCEAKNNAVQKDHLLELACPLCGAGMHVQRGITSRIICSSSTCGFALDSRLSAGVLSVLRRRGAL